MFFFNYLEEDNVLGQHETSLNGTNTDRISEDLARQSRQS